VDLAFEFMFEQEGPVYFAFAYPYPYSKVGNFLDEAEASTHDSEIYFHKEVLTHTNEGRKVHLITVTNRTNCMN
jgi:hypothetical protein